MEISKSVENINNNNVRLSGIDIVRTFAILFVISAHFFLNTSFSSVPFHGFSMFLQGIAASLFELPSALFMILTGFLCLKKEWSKSFYKGGVSVIVSYVFISIVTIFFRINFNGEHLTWWKWLMKITDYSAIPYGWFIEMWIGLFVLTPFLNILWKNIPTKRLKQILIVTLYLLTALPDFFNRYGMYLAPAFWEFTYPLCFYFIGTYIKEYQPEVSRKIIITIVLLICLINPTFSLIFAPGHSIIHVIGDRNGMFCIPLATFFFLFWYKWRVKEGLVRSLLQLISRYSLDMYLCSYMFDIMYYSYFKSHFFENQIQFGVFFFVLVPIVFISSFIFAYIKEKVFVFLHIPTRPVGAKYIKGQNS